MMMVIPQGPTMKDVVPLKLFSRKAILDEIQAMGVYCDFQPFQKEIEGYPGEPSRQCTGG